MARKTKTEYPCLPSIYEAELILEKYKLDGLESIKMNVDNTHICIENVKHQFIQDCMMTFRGFVFSANAVSIMMAEKNMPHDCDSFPVPLDKEKTEELSFLLKQTYSSARTKYFQRVSSLETHTFAEILKIKEETTE